MQRATAFRVSPDRLAAINPKLIRMKLGNFEYLLKSLFILFCFILFDVKRFVEKHLRLGDLLGNRFQIAIRDVTASDEILNTSVESLMYECSVLSSSPPLPSYFFFV